MSRENTVGVVIPARNEWHLAQGGGLLERILTEIPRDLRPTIYICANNSEPEFITQLRDVETHDDRIKVLDLGITKPMNWAYAYLYGLNIAKENSEHVVEMDANGSHDPVYIRGFLDSLARGNGAAFSTRFDKGGGISKYPLQRQAISRTGTILANMVLGLGQPVSDMTSGYEAFRSSVLGDVFQNYDIRKWLSVQKGPGHFYQTEMRATTIWRGHSFEMIPIEWGTGRENKPEKLPASTLTAAFFRLWELKMRKEQIARAKR